jgi:hypothetical protein
VRNSGGVLETQFVSSQKCFPIISVVFAKSSLNFCLMQGCFCKSVSQVVREQCISVSAIHSRSDGTHGTKAGIPSSPTGIFIGVEKKSKFKIEIQNLNPKAKRGSWFLSCIWKVLRPSPVGLSRSFSFSFWTDNN